MSFFKRLIKLEDKFEPLSVAIIGDGSEDQRRLESSYKDDSRMNVIFCGNIDSIERFLRKNKPDLIEVFAPLEELPMIAKQCLNAGTNVSLPMPPARSLEELRELEELSRLRGRTVRIRNKCFYYEPYQKAKEVIEEQKLGWPLMLRLVVKRNEFPEDNFDKGLWLLEKESDYLSLAEYYYGEVEKVFMINGNDKNGQPGSIILGFKFKEKHRLGYLLVDFVKELHIRTFSEPIFRQIWATGTAGVLMVNRGEGQILRAPVLFYRVKNYTHIFEDLKDEWLEVYNKMAQEMVSALRFNKPVISDLERARSGLRLALSALKSYREGKEIVL